MSEIRVSEIRGAPTGELVAFERGLVAFVRNFGFLQPERTPCGQPLHVSQAHALGEVAGNPGVSQQQLATELGLARATVSELVTELSRRGWITRRRDDADRRLQRLYLTATGRDIARDIAESRRKFLARILDDIEPSERAAVIAAVGKLAAGASTANLVTPKKVQR